MEFFTNVQQVGNKIWLRYTKDGKDYTQWIDDFQPTLYLRTQEKTGYKTVFNEYLKPIQTESVSNARELIKRYDGVRGFELYGNPNWEYSYLYEQYGSNSKYDPKLIKSAFVDIETKVGENSKGFPYPNSAAEEITLITHLQGGEYHIFACKDFDIDRHNIIGLNTFKHVYESEDAMLIGYVRHWSSNYPHAVTGWNIESFDVPYIINRVRQRLGGDYVKRLSPINQVKLEFMEDDPKKVRRVEIRGVEILDYYLLFPKYRPGKRDMSLNAMAEDFLNEAKVENPTGGSFKDFYTGDFSFNGKPENDIQRLAIERDEVKSKIYSSDDQSLIDKFNELDAKIKKECWDLFTWYNVRDVDIVKNLDLKLGMLNLTYTMAYLVGMNYSDVFGTVKPWDIFLQNVNEPDGIFFSVNSTKGVMPRKLMGGYVRLYKAGLYRDGVTLDATSLN